MSRATYARIYQTIWTDDRFARIVGDDALLGAFVRLLLLAEAAWPLSVAIPRSMPQASLDVLVEDGVIELHPHDTFRVHGLDAERERRSLQGKRAIAARWGTDSITASTTDSITASNTDAVLAPRPVTSSSSSSTKEGESVPSGWAFLYPEVVTLTGKHVAQGKFANDLCELAEQAGPERVIAAMRAVTASMTPVRPDIRALAFGVANALRRPPSGRDVAAILHGEQERADSARKAAERHQTAVDRRKRLLDEARAAEAADPQHISAVMDGIRKAIGK